MVRAGPVNRCVPSEAVELCILHGLQWWRAAGFLHGKKIMAVFLKVGKSFLLASELTCRVQDLEQLIKSTWRKHRVGWSSVPEDSPCPSLCSARPVPVPLSILSFDLPRATRLFYTPGPLHMLYHPLVHTSMAGSLLSFGYSPS